MSAYRLQLIDARNDIGIRNISGVCKSGEQAADYINRATRRLMKRGAWFGTEVLLRLCTNGCNVVFPRHVGTVMGLRLCGSGQMEIRNSWWAIIGQGNMAGWNSMYGGGFGYGYGYGNGFDVGGVQGYQPPGIDTNTVPVFSQISGNTGKQLRYHVVNQADYGKKITIYGKKFGGQPLQHQVGDVTEMGIVITATQAVSFTTELVTHIDAVVREETSGMTYLYEHEAATPDDNLRMLAAYEPSETNPSYRHMAIPALTCSPWNCSASGIKTWQFEALVKLAYIPVKRDADFLLIDDLDALAMAIQSIKFDEANDPENAEAYMKKAIRELNFDLRDKSPANQLAVQVNVMGSERMLVNPI
jgi:hypothetical protein